MQHDYTLDSALFDEPVDDPEIRTDTDFATPAPPCVTSTPRPAEPTPPSKPRTAEPTPRVHDDDLASTINVIHRLESSSVVPHTTSVHFNDLSARAKYFSSMGYRKYDVPGEGLCFFHSIRDCLFHEHQLRYELQQIKQMLMGELLEHSASYTSSLLPDDDKDNPEDEEYFLKNPQLQRFAVPGEPAFQNPNHLVNRVLKFFEDPSKFQLNICDSIISAAVNALDLNLVLYQGTSMAPDSYLEVVCVKGRNPKHLIRVLFDRGGLHYSPLLPSVPRSSPLISSPPIKSHVSIGSHLDFPCSPKNAEAKCSQQLSSNSDFVLKSTDVDSSDVTFLSDQDRERIHDWVPSFRRGAPFNRKMWDDVPAEVLDECPPDIDGKRKIVIENCSMERAHLLYGDRRWFKMERSGPSKKEDNRYRKVGRCKGSLVCMNDDCVWRLTQPNRARNRSSFKAHRKLPDSFLCESCEHFVQREPCPAVKAVDIYRAEKRVIIYHAGRHSCVLRSDRKNKEKQIVALLRSQEHVAKVPPAQLSLTLVADYISQNKWSEAQHASDIFSDPVAVQRAQRQHLAERTTMQGNTVDALINMKAGADEVDEYLIFKIHHHKLSNEERSGSAEDNNGDYVFKTSKAAVEIMLQMDRSESDTAQRDELAFFDGKHGRVNGFKSLGMWTLHHGLGKIVCLATMEARSEDTKNCVTFFQLVNKALQKFTGIPDYKFNPKAIMSDSAGSIENAVRIVFGHEFVDRRRFCTCQWHFNNNAEQRARNIQDPQQAADFLFACKNAVESKTIPVFNRWWRLIEGIAETSPNVKYFVNWWYARRSLVMTCFRGDGFPRMNLAEAANSAWFGDNLSLVKAVGCDVAAALLQSNQLKAFYEGTAQRMGKVPTQMQRSRKERNESLQESQEFVRMFRDVELLEEHVEGLLQTQNAFESHRSAKHRAPKQNDSLQGRSATAAASFNNLRRKKKGGTNVVIPEGDADVQEVLHQVVNSRGVHLSPVSPTAPPVQKQQKKSQKKSTVNSAAAPVQKKGRPSQRKGPASPSQVRGSSASAAIPQQRKGVGVAHASTGTLQQPKGPRATGTARAPMGTRPQVNRVPPSAAMTTAQHNPARAQQHGGCAAPVPDFNDRLLAQIRLAEQFVTKGKKPQHTRRSGKTDGVPVVVFAGDKKTVRICAGCRGNLKWSQPALSFPNDMIVSIFGARSWFNKATKEACTSDTPSYYHFKHECYSKHSLLACKNNFFMNENDFVKLKMGQMQVLEDKEVLKPIIGAMKGIAGCL